MQNAKSQKLERSIIIGTWTIVSHVSSQEGSPPLLKFQDKARTYTFKTDGTFILKFFGEAADFAMLGKWKLSLQSENKIDLSNIEIVVGAPPNTPTGNHTIEMLEFTSDTFSLMEYLVGDEKAGLSLYKKLK